MSSALRDIAESSSALRQSEDEILRLLAVRGDEDVDFDPETDSGPGGMSLADDDAIGTMDEEDEPEPPSLSASIAVRGTLSSPPPAKANPMVSMTDENTILDDEELVGAL